MGLFSKKTDSYLGVDIGGHSVKVVELYKHKGRAKLRTYGIAEKSLDNTKSEDGGAKEIAKMVKAVCRKAKVASDQVITSLPTFDVFTSLLNLPQMPSKDLPAAIRWEAKKLIPLPLEEMAIDWKILNIKEDKKKSSQNILRPKEGEVIKIKKKESKNNKILLSATPRKLGKKYTDIFKYAGMTLLDMEPEIFAMIRSLIGVDRSLVMLMDIGATNTNISVVDQGIPIINRGVDAGGLHINRLLQKIMDIPLVQAEQFKKDLANFTLANPSSGSIPKDLELALAPITNEVKYIFSIFQNQSPELEYTLTEMKNPRIEKIVLTGGSAILPYYADYLIKKFDTKVYVGDPWARVIYPEDLKFLLEEVGPKLAISIGLAMRSVI